MELECLAALWTMDEAPVAAVHQHLADQGRPLAYTTVLTVLDRLRRKQVVTRERHGRAFIYRPLVSREQMRARALERLVRNYFASRAELEAWLRDGHTPPSPPQAQPAEAPAELTEPLFID